MSIIGWPFNNWMHNVALAVLGSKESLYATYDLARNCIERGIPGDFVECGVFGGANVAVMARAIMDPLHYWPSNHAGNTRRVHIFDSFAGIPAPGPEDTEFLAAGHEAGLSFMTEEACRAHLKEWGIPDELLVWHVGMFNATVPQAIAAYPHPLVDGTLKQVALLRLDGDLYESTRVCVEHLYPLVSPGGWVIVDDWNLSGCRKAVMEMVIPAPVYWRKSP